ncbi:MAG TPA: methyl-accepting chemotaxis protein, partial [Thauera sp.]|nr:methyl-accepting chemotaxis protein [Thauera sp.]
VEQVFESIANNLGEHSAAARSIAGAVVSVANLADETEASASKVALEVGSLDRAARELSQAVGGFRIR